MELGIYRLLNEKTQVWLKNTRITSIYMVTNVFYQAAIK